MPLYFLGVGSDIDPHRNVGRALHALLELADPIHVGPVLKTMPVGIADASEFFLNLTLAFETALEASAFKERLNRIETALGRDRDAPDSKRRSRPIDLDILGWVEPDASSLPEELIPTEPYLLPSFVELARYLGLRGTRDGEPVHQPGVEVALDGCVVGAAACSIARDIGDGKTMMTRATKEKA